MAALPLLGALAVASFLFAAAVTSSEGVRAAGYATLAAIAFLAAAVDPATGYDQRNVFCFLLGIVFAITAAVRAQQMDSGSSSRKPRRAASARLPPSPGRRRC